MPVSGKNLRSLSPDEERAMQQSGRSPQCIPGRAGDGSCEVTLPQAEEASKPVLKAKTKQPEALWSLEGLVHLAHPFCVCEVLAAHSFPKVVCAFSLP